MTAAPPRSALATAAPFLLLMLVTALYCGTGMVQAVDTWISLAGGRHVAAHGVDDVDPFSFNSRPPAAAELGSSSTAWQRARAWLHPSGWINQNWLSHLLLFELADRLGLDALAAFRFVVYALVAALLLACCRVHDAGVAAGAVATAASLLALRPFAEFRAQELTTLLTAALLVVLALSVRRTPRLLWATVPLLALWSNLHGGFIYGLLAVGVYAATAWLPGTTAARWRRLPRAERWSAAGALVAAVVVSAVASPYRLANLTHPLAITVGSDAGLWRRVNEWLPAIAPGARLGEVAPFFAVLAAALLCTGLALRGSRQRQGTARGKAAPAEAWRPDLGALVLAAVTAAMALRSMRFVPLASLALAPVLAAALAELAGRAGRRRVHLAAPYLAGVVALVLASYWGVRFARAYVAPWPYTATPVSLFERMTWAHRFTGVGGFLRDNAVAGRAFNIWEEGGVLMWAERPAADSQRLPLAVFIDGRAQAAYPASVVRDYIELDVGGPDGVDAAGGGRDPLPRELDAMGRWVEARLRRDGVAIVVEPEERSGDGIFRALATRPAWRVVFRDPFHRIFVDTTSPEGRRLDVAVSRGDAVFPDESVRLLTEATRSAASADLETRRKALDAARRCFALRPTAAAVMAAIDAGSLPELSEGLAAFAREVTAGFAAGEQRYEREPGFLERAGSAIVAAEYLQSEAARRGSAAEAGDLGALAGRARAAYARALRRALWWG